MSSKGDCYIKNPFQWYLLDHVQTFRLILISVNNLSFSSSSLQELDSSSLRNKPFFFCFLTISPSAPYLAISLFIQQINFTDCLPRSSKDGSESQVMGEFQSFASICQQFHCLLSVLLQDSPWPNEIIFALPSFWIGPGVCGIHLVYF